eukprot:CAMPEP_0184646978 /NCGR_PEP_ID=MMETSP0308-20130426/3815_1 /TAXON_ID=38269 /ORGANISM="Gloeochaete witrockiana, Strain SAG 46.84" /LENGTH=87 /DNA_ID=CAMNT_0027077531 /DNA_START=63 /DNA_END=326 /DNA_ORIENTATION=+
MGGGSYRNGEKEQGRSREERCQSDEEPVADTDSVTWQSMNRGEREEKHDIGQGEDEKEIDCGCEGEKLNRDTQKVLGRQSQEEHTCR